MAVYVAVAAFAVAGIASAVGSIREAQAEEQAAQYNAAVAERNSKIIEQNRLSTLQQAEVDKEDHMRETRRMLASIRASYGSSGLEMSGSPLDVLSDTAIERALDTRRIEDEARARNRENAIQILGLREEQVVERTKGKNARTAGNLAALGTLAGTTGKALGAYGGGS